MHFLHRKATSRRFTLWLLFFPLLFCPPTTAFLESLATGLEVVIHTVESIQQTWDIVEATDVLNHKGQKANPNIKDSISKKHHELMARLVEIYRAIENIEHDVSREREPELHNYTLLTRKLLAS